MILAHGHTGFRIVGVSVVVVTILFVGLLMIAPQTISSVALADSGDTIEIPKPPAIYGDVYGDLNEDHIYEWKDPEWGVRSVTVTLEYKEPTAAASTKYETTTDDNGYYWFTNIQDVGTHTLTVIPPEGFKAITTTSVDIEVGADTVAKHQFGIHGPQIFAFIGIVSKSVTASSAASADVPGEE